MQGGLVTCVEQEDRADGAADHLDLQRWSAELVAGVQI
jgi:hypothetical protein